MIRLIDRRTEDGSRLFTYLPQTAGWEGLHTHLRRLPGVQIANYVPAELTEPWIDFLYRSHRFSVRQQEDRICLIVRNPQCPDVILYQLAAHCPPCGACQPPPVAAGRYELASKSRTHSSPMNVAVK